MVSSHYLNSRVKISDPFIIPAKLLFNEYDQKNVHARFER